MPPQRKRSSSSASASSPKKNRLLRETVCQNCGCRREATSLWRSNLDAPSVQAEDNVLCNACGLYRNEHGVQRPARYWRARRRSSSDPKSATPEEAEPTTPTPPTPTSPLDDIKTKKVVKKDKRNREPRGEGEVEQAASILMKIRNTELAQGDDVTIDDGIDQSQSKGRQHSPLPPIHYRPAWIFNRPANVRVVPPPLGFHDTPRRFIFDSPHSCCPSTPRSSPGSGAQIQITPSKMANAFSLEKYQLHPRRL